MEITTQVGAWAGREVLGDAIGRAIAEAAPVGVRVVLPERAGFVLSWPLELAHAGNGSLTSQGNVTFCYELEMASGRTPVSSPQPGARTAVAIDALRVLAVFSLPTESSVLASRRERYELSRLVRRIAARQRRQVTLSVVQYGVTRDRLAAMAEARDGWDVLHLSGHGGPGLFLLEKPDGSPDPIDTLDLVALLVPMRRRLRLAVVSACESAAATTAETLRWIGLDDQAEKLEQQTELGRDQGVNEQVMTGIARALDAQLGCPVIAMRYPVADDYAVAFVQELYERLLGSRDAINGGRGQSLAVAMAQAVRDALGPAPSPARPVLSLATPVLIASADPGPELVLDMPLQTPVLDTGPGRMEQFPPEREQFVGRTATMAKAGAALAPASGHTGVLLHGMAGSGKTACAVELIWRHEHMFEVAAFWRAAETDDELASGLASLAAGLEVQLRGFGFMMSDKIATPESVAAFAPRLRRMMEENRVLLVLDNLETLLTGSGQWRDPRWEPLIEAITSHDGKSRVILTSRIPPIGLSPAIVQLSVHALSLAESAELARELPGLRALLHSDARPVSDATSQAKVASDRRLVRRVLRIVQGHPALMELANAAAGDRFRLVSALDAAEAAARAGGGALDAFFRDGISELDAPRFLEALVAWTNISLTGLNGPAVLMARYLACLEDNDRQSMILDATWPNLWRRMELPGQPPNIGQLLATLSSAALIEADPPFASGSTDDDTLPAAWRMHPAIAETIRATTPAAVP